MKKVILSMLLLAFLSFSSFNFAANDPGENDTYTVVTVKELKEKYGEESLKIITSLELLDSDQVLITNNPCGGQMPCGGALAQARHQAQKLANACCCVQFFGVICCDPQFGALLAIDAIVMPNNCN